MAALSIQGDWRECRIGQKFEVIRQKLERLRDAQGEAAQKKFALNQARRSELGKHTARAEGANSSDFALHRVRRLGARQHKSVFPYGIEPQTFRMLSGRDNQLHQGNRKDLFGEENCALYTSDNNHMAIRSVDVVRTTALKHRLSFCLS